ncbi:hypothetical protein EDM33_14740 [Staphylococcus aureus]|nr:hypothetical protein EDM33_14740 [Staphylococcus aureus]
MTFVNPKRGPPFKTPGGFKTPGVFPPFGGKRGPQKFFPRGKNFSPGGKILGVFKNPKKGAPFLKTPGGFKNPRGFFPLFGGKRGPPKIFPPGKNFPPGEKFWGVFKNPKKGPPFKPRGFKNPGVFPLLGEKGAPNFPGEISPGEKFGFKTQKGPL